MRVHHDPGQRAADARSGAVTRREFLRLAGAGAVAAVAVACTGGGGTKTVTTGPTAAGSIDSLSDGATQLSLINAQSEMPTGRSLFTFGLSTSDGKLVEGGSPQVYLAQDPSQPAVGPFSSTWYRFAPASAFDDTSPRSPLPGFYTAEVDVASAGNWFFAGVTKVGGTRGVGTAAIAAKTKVIAPVGSKAMSVRTPVAPTLAAARRICTRTPPDPMHYVSLDAALRNGKPTVVSFATPLLCSSRLCGPVVDEQLLVYQKVGKAKANFIHIEEFLPGPDLQPPAPTLENQSPAFKAWGFTTEPWTVVVDGKGLIRARFEGPVVAAQIEDALDPLL
jgi:hypothetical protein